MNRRVLIASNVEPLRELFADWLTEYGYLVNVVSGANAVEIHCKTQDYAVLLIQNERGKGMEVIPKIRAMCPEIKIILLTGGMSLTSDEVKKAGGDAILYTGSLNATDMLRTIALLTEQGE